jgi:quercetin dioxygenase-like cupin family protein
MSRRHVMLLACGLAVLACTSGGSRGSGSARDAGEARSALAATDGVTPAATGAASQAPRIVPLGPMSGDVEILYGHPDSVGRLFVMRIRELPGTVIPPHSHPVDEHITVVQGTWYFAIGERFDSTALRPLRPGTYAFAPRGSTMFGAAPEAAVVQVHGIGPFHIHWRDGLRVLGEPGAAGAFRFRKGQVVTSPRGAGRIRQGYASGAIIQYEVQAVDGRVFMASEHELQPR